MIVQEILTKQEHLDKAVARLKSSGVELANAERDYKIELRKQALILRADGMAVTLIDKVLYGIQSVADNRFKRDVAESVYKANLEYINTTKLQLRILMEQYTKEYTSRNVGVGK